jgi:hypothetical protein
MSTTALIKFAPVVTLKRVEHDPTWQDPDRTLYWSGSLELHPGYREIPVIVDHDFERQVGTVDSLVEMPFADGPWVCAFATITDPPAWLEQRTKASFARLNYESTWVGRCERVARAHVTEISVLSPGTLPAEPLAEVTSLRRTQPQPAPAAASSVAPATAGNWGPGAVVRNLPDGSQEISYRGVAPLVRRPNVGQVLAVGGRSVRTPAGDPIGYHGDNIVVYRSEGSQLIFCGRAGRAEAIRDGLKVR